MSEEATPEVETEETPDLSGVPEEARDYVDPELYQGDEDYQRAIKHGWKPKELHERDGGDEADWTGWRQFNRRYDDHQDRKELKSKLADMDKNINALFDSFEDQKKLAVNEALSAKKAELEQAISEGETEQAVALSNEVSQMEMEQASSPKQPTGEPQFIADFRQTHPEFDNFSDEFNASKYAALSAVFDQQYAEASNNGQITLPELTAKKILEASVAQVEKDLGTTKAQKKAPKVGTPSTGKTQPDPVKGLSQEGKKIYDRIKTKFGEDAAKQFAQKTGGA